MNQKPHELFHPASYELPRDHYDELCTIRDKLLLMAQLAGTTTANREHDSILIIRRSLIGRLFGDLSFQLSDVLDDVAQSPTCTDDVPGH
jgi:hypothetical protein